MSEILGRQEKRFDVAKLKRLHKINGSIFILLFIYISYHCLNYIIQTKVELTPRASFHFIFAITIISFLLIKISIIHIYKQFYQYVKIFGLSIAILTIGLTSTSGFYYLLVTKFGKEKFEMNKVKTTTKQISIKTDSESIKRGKELYNEKCSFCHDPLSNEAGVGPGHKGILKNPYLPVSRKPATPENIVEQIKHPYKDMPSFSYLSDKEIEDLLAYLNTL
ncbi:MAG: hypothetical protein OHK0040_04430 [bacterium]